MAYIGRQVFFQDYTRIKTDFLDDCSSTLIASLTSAQSGQYAGNLATGGAVNSIDDTGTWTGLDLKGAIVLILGGPNYVNNNPLVYSFIKSNTDDTLTLETTFTNAFNNTTRYVIAEGGLCLNGSGILEVCCEFTGGAPGDRCDIIFDKFDIDANEWRINWNDKDFLRMSGIADERRISYTFQDEILCPRIVNCVGTYTQIVLRIKFKCSTGGGGGMNGTWEETAEVDVVKVGGVPVPAGAIPTTITDLTDTLDVAKEGDTADTGILVYGRYTITPVPVGDGDLVPVRVDSEGNIILDSDIQIGAVELKDGATDLRNVVKPADTPPNLADPTLRNVLMVQQVDVTGKVPPAGESEGNAPFVMLTDGVDDAEIQEANDATTGGSKVLLVQGVDDAGTKISTATIETNTTSIDGKITVLDYNTTTPPPDLRSVNGIVVPGAGGAVPVQGSSDGVLYNTLVNATATKNALLEEDSPSVSESLGIQALIVRNDVGGSLVDTNGDYSAIQTDEFGRVRIVGDSPPLLPTHTSPADGTVVFTTNVTLTCSSFPFTVDDANCIVLSIFYKPSGGRWKLLSNGRGGVSITAAANVITITGAGTPFAAGDSYVVGIFYKFKAYNSSGDYYYIGEKNPLNLQVLEESLVDATNASGTVYYPSSLGGTTLGYKDLSLTGKFIDADNTITMTFEITNDEDPVTADWIAINGFRTDTTPPAYVNSITCASTTVTFSWDFDNLNYRYWRVKVIYGDATNTEIIKIRRKAL